MGTIAFLAPGAAGLMLWVTPFTEPKGDSGGAPPPAVPVCAVGATARDPLVPVRDGPFLGEASRWFVWREDRTVKAVHDTGATAALTLPAPPDRLLRPALQRIGGDVRVFALEAGRRSVACLTVPRMPGGIAAVTGTIALPREAASGAVGFGPTGEWLAMLLPDADGVTLLLARVDGASPPRAVPLKGLRCPPDFEPAIGPGANRETRFAVLGETGGVLTLAEVVIPADGGAPVATMTPLGVPVSSGWFGAVVAAADGTRLVASTPRRWYASSGRGAMPAEHAFSGAVPARPVTLAPTEQGALLLVNGGGAGPRMLPI